MALRQRLLNLYDSCPTHLVGLREPHRDVGLGCELNSHPSRSLNPQEYHRLAYGTGHAEIQPFEAPRAGIPACRGQYLVRPGPEPVPEEKRNTDSRDHRRCQCAPRLNGGRGPSLHDYRSCPESRAASASRLPCHPSLAARLTGAVERPVGALPPLARRRGVVQFAGTQR